MSKNEENRPNLDERLADYLVEQSSTFSRRSMLMKVGRIVLRLSGLALIPLLPVDRRFAVSAQSGCSWQTCGMCGALCNTCCNSSGGYSQCPTCTGMVKAADWGLCCYNSGSCTGTFFTYSDCCSSSSSASSCQGTLCQTACYPGFPAYCDGQHPYYGCTIVTPGGSC